MEPENKEWDQLTEKSELERSTSLPVLAQQLLFATLPDLLWAWNRGGDAGGVLQVQANGDFTELSTAKWRLVREGKTPPKVPFRVAFLSRKDYLANLAENVHKPSDQVAAVDTEGKPLKIAEINNFLPEERSGFAAIHIDIKNPKMSAILLKVPCDDGVKPYLGTLKEPEKPKAAIDNVLALQKTTGFPRALPRYLGFQSWPGDLNFPVIDLERDAAPDASCN